MAAMPEERGSQLRTLSCPVRHSTGCATRAQAVLSRRRLGERPRRDSAAVCHTERLVEAEQRHIRARAHWTTVPGTQPTLGCVLDQKQAALVAPAPPARAILGKPERVDHVQGPDGWRQQSLELLFVRLEGRNAVIEPAFRAGPHNRFDLGSVVIGRSEDLVARTDADPLQGRPEPLARLEVETARRFLQRKRKRARRPPRHHGWIQRREDADVRRP
jgi:hypothetical protein